MTRVRASAISPPLHLDDGRCQPNVSREAGSLWVTHEPVLAVEDSRRETDADPFVGLRDHGPGLSFEEILGRSLSAHSRLIPIRRVGQATEGAEERSACGRA